MLKDYDISLHYHPGKTNMVGDAHSRLSIRSLAYVEKEKWELVKDINRLAKLKVHLLDFENSGMVI